MYSDNEIYLTFDTEYLKGICSAIVSYESEKLPPLLKRWNELRQEYNSSKHWFWGYDKGNLIYDELRHLERNSIYMFGKGECYSRPIPLSAVSDLCLYRTYAFSVLNLIEKFEGMSQIHLPPHKAHNIFNAYNKLKEG